MMGKKAVVPYTIGYQGRSLPALVRTLKDHGVERLVDVRLTPHSRQRGFSVMSLFEGLRRAGINYEHVKDLGNPPEIRDRFFAGDLVGGRAAYRQLLTNGHSHAVEHLISLARIQPTAILCRESDVKECHRAVVAEVAAERAPFTLKVEHL